jgi:hypothetical protein
LLWARLRGFGASGGWEIAAVDVGGRVGGGRGGWGMRDVPVYDELQFRLAPGRGDDYDVLVIAADGAAAHGGFSFPFSPEALENFRLAVDPGTRRMRGSRSLHREKAKRFGMQLFEALVADSSVRAVYSTARHDAEQAARGLRITLYLTRAPELADVPWEFLYQRPDFLAQSVWTPVVRYLDLPESRRPLRVSPPLRILGMVSRPLDDELAELDAAREKANLEQALSGLVAAGIVEIRWLAQATMRALQQEVAHGEDFHVFHYIGHGEYDERSGEGSLVLERPDGRPHEVSGERLGSTLCDRKTLRLAVLNACEAAKTAPQDPLAGVAANLIEHEVPAVVGMQFAITDEGAIAFAQEFYATLAEGYPVDAAVTEARRAMAADDEIEWGTPVLFMRVADGRLFDLAAATPTTTRQSGTTRLAAEAPGADATTRAPTNAGAAATEESVRARERPRVEARPSDQTPGECGAAPPPVVAMRTSAPPAAVPTSQRENGTTRSMRRSARRAAFVAAFCVLAAAAITLGASVLRPQPRPAPLRQHGTVKINETNTGTRMAEYIDRKRKRGETVPGVPAAARSSRGTIVDFQVSTTGYAGKTLSVRWSLYRVDTSHQVGTIAVEKVHVTADNASEGDFIWVPTPPQRTRYYITLELYDQSGSRLGRAKSVSFRT